MAMFMVGVDRVGMMKQWVGGATEADPAWRVVQRTRQVLVVSLIKGKAFLPTHIFIGEMKNESDNKVFSSA